MHRRLELARRSPVSRVLTAMQLRERRVGIERRALAGCLGDVLLQLVVERLVLAVGAHRDRRRHHLRAAAPADRVGSGSARARHGAAVAAVRQHEDAHALGEAAQLEVQLVVDQLAVEQAPGLVLLVLLLAGDVGHLAAVARVGEEEQVARLQRSSRAARIAASVVGARGLPASAARSASCPALWRSPPCRSRRTRTRSARRSSRRSAAGLTAFRPMWSDSDLGSGRPCLGGAAALLRAFRLPRGPGRRSFCFCALRHPHSPRPMTLMSRCGDCTVSRASGPTAVSQFVSRGLSRSPRRGTLAYSGCHYADCAQLSGLVRSAGGGQPGAAARRHAGGRRRFSTAVPDRGIRGRGRVRRPAEAGDARPAGQRPGALDFSYDVGPDEAAIVSIRHPSGALTFHLPVQSTSRGGRHPNQVRFVVTVRSTDVETGTPRRRDQRDQSRS